MKTSLVVSVCIVMAVTFLAVAGDDGPVFLQWLMPTSPSDQAIREYWEKADADQASAEELLDLGTMLFYRGYPKDAIRMFKRALKLDKNMSEAWFRIGLVNHREGELRAAEKAYMKCLDILTGHGWCNFYMGLLQERKGKPSKALYYYRRAFKFAPELSNPRVNPEVLYSELQLAAVLKKNDHDRFTGYLPMPFAEPQKVSDVRSKYEPTPVPTPIPVETEIPVRAKPPKVVAEEESAAANVETKMEYAPGSRPPDQSTLESRRGRRRSPSTERLRRPRRPTDSTGPAPTPTPSIE